MTHQGRIGPQNRHGCLKIGPIAFCLFCLDESLDNVDYAIFDDMQGGLKFFHSYKFWLGCQTQFYATDKYKGKKLIHWGRPSIYIANQNPLCDEGVDHDWLIGNCEIIEVTTSLLVPVE